MDSHQCSSQHGRPLYSVYQTIDEMTFQKGIWAAACSNLALDGDLSKIKQLLQKMTDPDSRDSFGYTALHYAARNNQLEACKVLLSSGANPNAQTNGGATPLHRAAYVGHSSIVDLLLKYKAKPLIIDSDGKTPLHKAVEGNHSSVAQILLENCSQAKDILDSRGNKPHHYVNPSNAEMLALLL